MRPKRYLPEESKQFHHDCPTPTQGLDQLFFFGRQDLSRRRPAAGGIKDCWQGPERPFRYFWSAHRERRLEHRPPPELRASEIARRRISKRDGESSKLA